MEKLVSSMMSIWKRSFVDYFNLDLHSIERNVRWSWVLGASSQPQQSTTRTWESDSDSERPSPNNHGRSLQILRDYQLNGKVNTKPGREDQTLAGASQERDLWNLGSFLQDSFECLNKVLTSSPVLALLHPSLETVLLQKQTSGESKLVVYILDLWSHK